MEPKKEWTPQYRAQRELLMKELDRLAREAAKPEDPKNPSNTTDRDRQ